jgi:hypothetical protein
MGVYIYPANSNQWGTTSIFNTAGMTVVQGSVDRGGFDGDSDPGTGQYGWAGPRDISPSAFGTGPSFNVPDLRGRVAVGLDASQAEFSLVSYFGGEKSHVLTVNEMPVHKHGFTNGVVMPGGVPGSISTVVAAGSSYGFQYINAPGLAAMNNEGGGAGHNVLSPFLTLNYLIKA